MKQDLDSVALLKMGKLRVAAVYRNCCGMFRKECQVDCPSAC